MNKSLLIEVSVFDDDTGTVISKHVCTYDGPWGYEVVECFENLCKKFAPIIDEGYEP